VSTPASSEPLSLADAKLHLKVDTSDDDALITSQIVVARKWIELHCNKSLPQQTLKAYFDSTPPNGGKLLLPQSPCSSITSIEYIDTDGTTQTWASSLYTLDSVSVPARVYPAYGESWPSLRNENNSLIITYVAGKTSVDEEITHAMKLMIGSLYMSRENDCPVKTYLGGKA
jgi:uncharacterized phiE125 gp8 family phage protein